MPERRSFLVLPMLALAATTQAQGASDPSGLGPIYPMRVPATSWDLNLLADLDGDGLTDLIGSRTGVLAFLPSVGDTTFGSPIEVAIDGIVTRLTAADMDGDGDVDIALVELDHGASEERVRTVLNQGGTALVAAPALPLQSQAKGADFADVNQDGFVDLVTGGDYAQPGTGTSMPDVIAVLLSDGTGAFVLHHEEPTAEWTDDVVVLDLDEDGFPDVVNSLDWPMVQNQVRLFRNAGGGTLDPQIAQAIGTHDRLARGDFDEDGREDLLVQVPGGFQVRFTDGSGLVGPGGAFVSAGTQVRPLDLDGDGHLDVVSALVSGGVERRYGVGDGTFESSDPLALPWKDARVLVGDVNGDGLQDWVQGLEGVRTLVLPAVTPRQYELGERTALQGENGLLIDDFDGDGMPDLLDFRASNGRVFMRSGLGDGTFSPPLVTTLGVGGHVLASADVDGDGDPDLLGTTEGPAAELFVARNGGAGIFGMVELYAVGGDLQSCAPGDFDGDGELDLALLRRSAHDVQIYLGAGAGTFVFSAVAAVGQGRHSVIAEDFDRDGALDLVTTDDLNGGIWLLLGAGDGTFQAPASLDQTDADFHKWVVAADFENDGFPDVIDGREYFPNPGAGGGPGGFAPELDLDPASAGDLAAVDADLDGVLDLAVAGLNWGASGPAVLQGRGDGTFAVSLGLGPRLEVSLVPADAVTLQAADVNGDLRPDLVLHETEFSLGAADAWVLLNGMQPPAIASVEGLYAAQAGGVEILGTGLDASTQVFVGGDSAKVIGVGPGMLEIALPADVPGTYDLEVQGSLGTTVLPGALERWPVLSAGEAVAGGVLPFHLDNHGGGIYAVAFSLTTLSDVIPLGPAFWYGVGLAAPTPIASGVVDPAAGRVSLALPVPASVAGLSFGLQGFAQQAGAGVVPDLAFTNLVKLTVAAP